MSFAKIKAVATQVLNRVPATRGKGEQATKQSLILPLLDVLGYDIWNPAEVCLEYDADFAIKKAGQKEKVDVAILLNGIPRIYIETKALDELLDGHEGQLARYFNATPSVTLGILTNGLEWRFFYGHWRPERHGCTAVSHCAFGCSRPRARCAGKIREDCLFRRVN